MSELRYNLITRDWVVISTERAKRPHDFKKPSQENKPKPPYKKDCPFCIGNEGGRTDETYCLGDKSAWKTRAVYNKFPALSPELEEKRSVGGFYNSITGFGVHEVIIENPLHNRYIPTMSDEEVANIFRTYRDRYVSIQEIKGIEAITIFKNHGPGAGCSLEHPHSQLVATPIVPPDVRDRMEQAARYFDIIGRCSFCEMMEQELEAKERLVLETDKFVSFVPYAAAAPFIIWVLPRRHMASFDEIDDNELRDLSINMRVTLAKLYYGLDNPDFNFLVRSVPVREKGVEFFHWGISIIPRLSQPAGFELGSGMYINASLPEECAKFLRQVDCK
ncbi:MAG: galactose-1-phosphate uridylyltransferase [Candidatus Omnitrophica bacterium]|nr:galactose-1-phosphate uridylyltransferase [Candidatus Omnitrophota bacterium]